MPEEFPADTTPAKHCPLASRHFWICIAVSCALFLVWSSVNQFEEAGVRVAGRLIGPIVGKLAYGKGRRDDISLLLLGDADIGQMGETWPLAYSTHADILRTLAQYKPKAVMVDILFLDNRKDASIGDLAGAMCELQRQGIRIYLAALPTHGNAAETWHVRPELRQCATLVAIPKNEDELDSQAWNYDLHAPENPVLPTAAMAIYQDAKNTSSKTGDFEQPIGLIWGSDSDHESDRRQPDCHGVSVSAPFLHPIASILGETHGEAACGFHPVVSGAALLSGADEGYLRHALANRYVFYGVSLTGAADIIKSPLHGNQPGSAVHAMALDNLLYFGAQYKHPLSLNKNAGSVLFVVLAIIVITLAKRYLEEAFDHRPQPGISRPTGRVRRILSRLRNALGKIGASRDAPVSKWHSFRGFASRVLVATLWFSFWGVVLAWIGYHWFDLAPMAWVVFALFPLFPEVEEIAEKITHFLSLP